MALDEHGDHPSDKEWEKRGGMTHHRRGRHARGGRAKEEGGEKVNEYNAQGSPEAHEAADEEPDFKRGGKAKEKRARGGMAHGEHEHERADRPRRGKRAEGGATQALAHGGRTHHGHGGHHHDGHEHEVEHDGDHGVHHHGAHGHAVHHHGSGDLHVHRKGGGKLARGGRAMAGHSPYSSGRHLNAMEAGSPAQRGHEGQKVPEDSD